jgi:sulfite reductase beta subunit-like hemoprotein
MSNLNALIDNADYSAYRDLLAGFEAGSVDSNKFIGERLKLGVYAQRQDGLCMVRTKLPGGKLSPRQLVGFAEAVEHSSDSEVVHISTRQNIQFHHVPLANTPALLEHLALFGIGSREAGGNTVRNITACPLAGVCPQEHVDVTPYLQRVARYFVRHPLTQSLPRKFKMSFSGCATDCAQGMIHDLAVIATRGPNNEQGFQIRVGGGLGAKPVKSVLLTEFVTEAELIPAIEAVLRLHDRHSDRTRKAKSRIKFLIERFGAEDFRAKFVEEFARTNSAFDPASQPRAQWQIPVTTREIGCDGAPRKPLTQRQAERFVVPVQVPHGDLNGKQLRGLAKLLNRYELYDIRTSQDQNLMIFDVPTQRVPAVTAALESLNLGVPKAGDRVVACPGTATCTLGITASSRVASLLSGGESDLSVRVNGCQNSCANSDLADVGMFGKGKRHHGKLIPSYTMQFAGSGLAGGEIGFDGPDIPAARVPSAVARIEETFATRRNRDQTFYTWARNKGADYFNELLSDLSEVSEFELPFLLRDYGDSKVFAVESVGVGECAGAKMDPIEKALLDAKYERGLRDAFAAKHKFDEALESLGNAITLEAQAVALRAGQKLEEPALGELAVRLDELDIVDDSEIDDLNQLLDDLQVQKSAPDELAYPLLAQRADAWLALANGEPVEQRLAG